MFWNPTQAELIGAKEGKGDGRQAQKQAGGESLGGEGDGVAANVEQLVLELTNPATRENALLELSKKRETFPDLAPYLWHSFGTISALLQEIVSIYPMLNPPSLTAQASNRVCNALALLQCVASHYETRGLFLKAHVPLFLYPFLNTMSGRGRSSTSDSLAGVIGRSSRWTTRR